MKSFLKYCLLICIPIFSVACHPVTHYCMAKILPSSVVEIGDDMVDAKLLDINGNKKRISDYLSNKYLLLNFCSNGCGYCIESLPEMEKLSKIYHEKIIIISINVDTNAQWRKAITEYNTPWVNLRDPKTVGGLAYKYGADGRVPYYVIISPDGKVVDKWSGFSNGYLEKKLSESV
jgi:Peroxiredoxin